MLSSESLDCVLGVRATLFLPTYRASLSRLAVNWRAGEVGREGEEGVELTLEVSFGFDLTALLEVFCLYN